MSSAADAARLDDVAHSGSWPRDVSHKPVMSIGAVVKRLAQEFPAIRTSKVRFLEEKGVVSPARTATGYRKFSEADYERLRFCLATQRDSYVPIDDIVGMLAALDAGHEAQVAPTARIVASQGELVAPVRADLTMSARELRDLTGISDEELTQLVSLGLLAPDLGGYFPRRALTIVHQALALERQGIPLRNLRYLMTYAKRHVDLADQVTSGRKDRSGADKERRLARAGEIVETLAALATELARLEVEQLD